MIYQRDESFVIRKIDDETILVPVRGNVAEMGSIYILNEVGARIWELMDGKRALAEIMDVIRVEYDAPDNLKEDVEAFISDLESIGAIRPSL